METDVAPGAAWRHSFSVQEKAELTNMDKHNECKRQCIRIIKAIFKLRSNGLFKMFTSYHIKTVAFRMQKKRMSWNQQDDLGKCVLMFLKEVHDCLVKGELMHYFEPSINLLDKINETQKTKQQIINTLAALLQKEKKFYELIQ